MLIIFCRLLLSHFLGHLYQTNQTATPCLLEKCLKCSTNACLADLLICIWNNKRILFFGRHFPKRHKFIYFVHREYTQIIFINIFIIYIFKYFYYLKIWYSTRYIYNSLIKHFADQVNTSIYNIVTYFPVFSIAFAFLFVILFFRVLYAVGL